MPDQKTILRTIPFFYPYVNGPTKEAWLLSCKLPETGWASHVFTGYERAENSPETESHDGWSVRRFRESFRIMAYGKVAGLPRQDDVAADLVYAHCYRNGFTAYGADIAKKKDVPYVIQPHGTLAMYRFIHPRWLWTPYVAYDAVRKTREILAADAVVVSVEHEKEEAIAFGVKPDRVHVIPFGCDPFDYATRKPVGTEERLRLLFVGRIAPDRRVEMILEALGLLSEQRRREMELRIVGPIGLRSTLDRGDAYLNRLKSQVDALQLKDVVQFVGAKYGSDLEEEYKAADLFVYTSDYENFGQTVLEAASYGCPVVATKTGVAADLVVPGETGELVEFNDAESLARALESTLEDRERLRQMSEAMFRSTHEKYSWAKIIDQHSQLYRSLI